MKDPRLSKLFDDLLDEQIRLRHDPAFAVAVIVAGVPTAGRSEVVNELLDSLDPKSVNARAFAPPDREDRRRPMLWRYWQTLPARGRITFLFTGWYNEYLAGAMHGAGKKGSAAKRIAESIRRLEAMLVADRVRVLKVYLTTDAKTQRKRLARLRADKLTRWRVTREDLWLAKHHKQVARAAARCIKATDHPDAPWHVIDGSNEDQRLFSAAALLHDEMRAGFAHAQRRAKPASRRVAAKVHNPLPSRADRIVEDEEYDRELALLQGRLALLLRRSRFQKHALVLAFEGMDAAGKGGAIQRITQAMDARQYRVVPVSAPTSEEMLYPYLWRFWRHVPESGDVTIYDRSWYGRVLVERVRGLTPESDWRRAYDEIREFELELTESGVVVAKFWLNVGKQEQLKRFKARDEDPLKRFKVDQEDWKNREYYDAYQVAAREMIERTHARFAPWTIIPADHKKTARLLVLEAVCERVERALD